MGISVKDAAGNTDTAEIIIQVVSEGEKDTTPEDQNNLPWDG